jgi:hypothetical protein
METVEEFKKKFETEIKSLESKAFSAGRASASGVNAAARTAESLAERARAIRAENPGMSNIAATRRAYAEANVPIGQ